MVAPFLITHVYDNGNPRIDPYATTPCKTVVKDGEVVDKELWERRQLELGHV